MSWFWTRPYWRTVPKFDESIIVLAQKTSVRERELLHRTGADVLDILIGEAMTQSLSASYSIEGEKLDSSALRSSVVRQLGLDIPEWRAIGSERSQKEDRAVFAALSFLNADWTLSPSALCRTHRMLEPGIEAWGRFRTEPEYIVDGSGRKVYEAPPPSDVPSLMRWFCDWWNEDRGKLPPGIGAAMAHIFFVVVHPFEDGNGRMSRLLMEKAVGHGLGTSYRPYALSPEIDKTKSRYYELLDGLPRQGGVERFVEYVVRIQTFCVERAERRALALERLAQLEAFHENSENPLSPLSRLMLREMAMDPDRGRWNPFDASAAIEDVGEEDPWDVWEDLEHRGIIANGELRMEPEPPMPFSL